MVQPSINSEDPYKSNVYAVAVLLEAFVDKIRRDNPSLYPPVKKPGIEDEGQPETGECVLGFAPKDGTPSPLLPTQEYQRQDHIHLFLPVSGGYQDDKELNSYLTGLRRKYLFQPLLAHHSYGAKRDEYITIDVTELLANPEKLYEILVEDRKETQEMPRRTFLNYLTLAGAAAGLAAATDGGVRRWCATRLAEPQKSDEEAFGKWELWGGLSVAAIGYACDYALTKNIPLPEVPNPPGQKEARHSDYVEGSMAITAYEQLLPIYGSFRQDQAESLDRGA